MARRLWWWLLPYYGWTGGTRESRKADVADGATPPPWYAFPLSWTYWLVDWWLDFRKVNRWKVKER